MPTVCIVMWKEKGFSYRLNAYFANQARAGCDAQNDGRDSKTIK